MPQKRIGRPLSDNPKSERVTVRIDKEQSRVLKNYCEDNNVDKAGAIREGINRLREKE